MPGLPPPPPPAGITLIGALLQNKHLPGEGRIKMGGLKQRLYKILGGLNKVFYGRCASAMVPLALQCKYYLTPCPKNEILRPLFNKQKYVFI